MMRLSVRNDKTASLVLSYRGWQKSVTSNYRPYLALISPDGRLRPRYKMHGTKTGRMSCEKPNLQQIPRVSTSLEWTTQKGFHCRGWV
jgi:DNA polymerase I-like protein with 3'-5' exonuclease and polymerase domains